MHAVAAHREEGERLPEDEEDDGGRRDCARAQRSRQDGRRQAEHALEVLPAGIQRSIPLPRQGHLHVRGDRRPGGLLLRPPRAGVR